MSTIPSTPVEFKKDLAKFIKITGDKTTPEESVKGAHRAISLRYLGLVDDVSEEEIETCAMLLNIAVSGTIARGWNL